MNEQELLKRLAELPREVRPNRDPWPQILQRISRSGARAGSNRSAPAWLFRAVAASVVLVFAAGLLFKPLWDTDPTTAQGRPAPVSVADTGRAGPPGLLYTIDAEYLAAFKEFINIGGSHGGLTPQTVEKIEMGWAALRVTETALATALEDNPGDQFLNERMLELRSRQLGFLKQLVTLDRNNRRMTT